MGIIYKLRVFYFLHSHAYEELLKISDCDLFDPAHNGERIKYQALSSFYLKNYYHSRKCYEILSDNGVAGYDDYNKLAYIYSRHNEKENAIIAWCKSLEKKKNNLPAKKALDYIKGQGREVNLIEDTFFEEITCREPAYIPFKKMFLTICAIVLAGLLILSAIRYLPGVIKKIRTNTGRKEIAKVVIDDYNPNIIAKPKNEEEHYSYNENEIRKQFDTIKDKIIHDDTDQAIIQINRLRLSNASISVKAKLDILESFIDEPDYADFKNSITYQEIKENPAIYNNVYIKWYGRIVNSVYDRKAGEIGFNLVVGDEANGIVEGIIPVLFTKRVIAENNKYGTVFGRVVVAGDRITIDGKFLIRD